MLCRQDRSKKSLQHNDEAASPRLLRDQAFEVCSSSSLTTEKLNQGPTSGSHRWDGTDKAAALACMPQAKASESSASPALQTEGSAMSACLSVAEGGCRPSDPKFGCHGSSQQGEGSSLPSPQASSRHGSPCEARTPGRAAARQSAAETIAAATHSQLPQRLELRPSPEKRPHDAGQHPPCMTWDQHTEPGEQQIAQGLAAAERALDASLGRGAQHEALQAAICLAVRSIAPANPAMHDLTQVRCIQFRAKACNDRIRRN